MSRFITPALQVSQAGENLRVGVVQLLIEGLDLGVLTFVVVVWHQVFQWRGLVCTLMIIQTFVKWERNFNLSPFLGSRFALRRKSKGQVWLTSVVLEQALILSSLISPLAFLQFQLIRIHVLRTTAAAIIVC